MNRISILIAAMRDESGATAVEYGLILGCIVIAILTAMSTFADSTISLWHFVETKTEAAFESNPV